MDVTRPALAALMSAVVSGASGATVDFEGRPVECGTAVGRPGAGITLPAELLSRIPVSPGLGVAQPEATASRQLPDPPDSDAGRRPARAHGYGVWVGPDGLVYLDEVDIFPDRWHAMVECERRGEQACYDLERGCELYRWAHLSI